MKIGLRLVAENSQCQTFQRFLPALRSLGADCSAWDGRSTDCDVAIVHESLIDFDSLPSAPYIVLSSRDGADLTATSRKLLCGDNPPAAIYKNCTYAAPSLYNTFHGRWHEKLIEQAFTGTMAPWDKPRQIPADRLARIKSPFGFGAYAKPQEILSDPRSEELARNAERPIDVSFAGTVSYPSNKRDGSVDSNGVSWIERHRLACCDAIEALADKGYNVRVVRGRGLRPAEYRELLWQSKVAVCPAGWGEASYRFYEAIYAGCCLIGPNLSHVRGVSDHYRCRWNFIDIERSVAEIKEAWRDAWQWGTDLRDRIAYRNSPEHIAGLIWRDVEAALSKCADTAVHRVDA